MKNDKMERYVVKASIVEGIFETVATYRDLGEARKRARREPKGYVYDFASGETIDAAGVSVLPSPARYSVPSASRKICLPPTTDLP